MKDAFGLPEFVWPEFVLSDLWERIRGSIDGASPSTFRKCHRLLPRQEIHRSSPQREAHRFPVEIFSEIFLYTVQAEPRSGMNLMLVCRHWYYVMITTPGIHSQLRIHRETTKEEVEGLGKWWLVDVIVDLKHVQDKLYRSLNPVFDPVEFHASFMAAADGASRWRSLALLSLPPPGEYEDLQITHPLQHLESFKLVANCELGSFLEPLLKAIITTVTTRFTVMEVFHPDATLYILQHAHFQIFSSLKTLRLICRRPQNPVDVLSCLPKLEIFEAHYLFLPIYPPGVDLPLTQTLRVLHLKSVSVQWMAGQIFPALEECSIIFPLHSDTIQSVDMPSCLNLKYHSNNLSALEHFHISTLDKLEINCGQWRTRSGDLQLIRLHPIFTAQSLTCLHMEIKCSERLLTYMLRLAPALEELWMRLSSPHALSTSFFLALAAGGHKANTGPSSRTIIPFGRKLKRLHLHYKRWLRGPERNALIPAFGTVVASHPSEDGFRFQLSLDEGSKLQEWYILGPKEIFDIEQGLNVIIGVPSPDGIVHLQNLDVDHYLDEPLPKSGCIQLPRETEYIKTKGFLAVSDYFLFFFHSLKEVRMPCLDLRMNQDLQFSPNEPLFHSLKVLHVETISSSFFAGQTFHKLERYKESRIYEGDIPGQGPLTEMPVCTRLDVPLRRLATLKLPQIRELGLFIDAEHDHIWEKHIEVNANLSGLKLLHLRSAGFGWPTFYVPTIAVLKILRSLPALETLIIDASCLNIAPYVHFFEAFVPINVPGPCALNQSNWKGQISAVLCPRLESLQIQCINLTRQAELMHVLKDIVTLRAIIGCPLKSFTFHVFEIVEGPLTWQLIGRDNTFKMEVVVPAEYYELDI